MDIIRHDAPGREKMSSRWSRLLRAALTASVTTASATILHMAAGGVAPTGTALLTALVLAGALSALAAGRASLWRTAVAVLASQAAFHTVFSVLGLGTGRSRGTSESVSGHPEDSVMAHGDGVLAVLGVSVDDHHGAVPVTIMLLAHLLSAAFTLWLLHSAGRSAAAMGTVLRRLVIRFSTLGSGIVVVPVPRRRTPAVLTLVPPIGAVLAAALRYRGPPRSA